ncbi:MAG: sulfatase-like hydrolase/transferase [Cyclobacteriaceae bacterium]|nr:sulfatase-like hydrolase/transferase [Cyclobacteriaceae bacterium]
MYAINRYTWFLVLFSSLLFDGCQKTERKQLPPPHILWIVSEDNSPFLGIYGDEFATTPHLDKFATSGIVYDNAFAAAPVCAPTRSTIITGMYANSMGTQHMRSTYPIPEMIKFFPRYLREAGYYCTNNAKKDYNTIDQEEAWDESSNKATYRNRKPGQRFFHIKNFGTSHESSIHDSIPWNELKHDPEKVSIPPYHPQTPEMKHDWAQYYDRIQQMDEQVGEVLRQLEEDGLADSTIVFYYSDHGGVLGRSKRFMYESGLKVPLIIHFPEAYRHLAPGEGGTRTDRLVSFVDFAPTILSLAGLDVPDYMQGVAFLGEKESAPREYTYNFRGRMDERFDMSRSVRNKQFRYIRNYMPHRIYAQYIEYLWRAPSMKSWEREFKAGNLNEIQAKFWGKKPPEELFDVVADPHNIKNLAEDPTYKDVLEELRTANRNWQSNIKDAGYLPEPYMIDLSEGQTIYDFTHSDKYPFEELSEMVEKATLGNSEQLPLLSSMLKHENNLFRYWGITGCLILGKEAVDLKDALLENLSSEVSFLRTASAEALYQIGEKEIISDALNQSLKDPNLMARVQALNVLENMGEDARVFLETVKKIVDNAPPNNRDYDVRAAERIVDKFVRTGK